MKVMFKSGSKIITKDGISAKAIRKKMEGIMLEHPHLCATCSSTACGHLRGFFSEMVYSAVRTHERDYIFGCIAYRKRKPGEILDPNSEYSISNNIYEPNTYSVVHPTVKEYVRRMK